METFDRNYVNIEDEMRRSYLDYAMSVIIGRALPDVRDGFKPVHRRVLWAMNELGNQHNKAYKKSARIVGDVIGKYHPHGDSAVYDTIVRLAQDFSMRYPLVDGQGNFGSVDGDSAAAMRYTEARMSKIAGEILADIEKETVTFNPNYDESLSEPSVMPSRVPNLLLNGSERIAELVNEKKLDGIADLRDESSRDGMRVVVELKRDAIPQIVLNKLYKLTPMQSTFGVINLAIVQGQPRVLKLREMLEHFVEFRREVVRRRTEYDLRKAKARAHILEGLNKAIDALDYIIPLIRNARSVDEARQWLTGGFDGMNEVKSWKGTPTDQTLAGFISKMQKVLRRLEFSEQQAQAILDLQLRRLSALERQKIIDEGVELSIEDMIADEDVAITVTKNGYVKRTPVTTYTRQGRGGKGRSGAGTGKNDDYVEHLFIASTHSYLMIFTDDGQVYKLKVHQIPDAMPSARGKAIVNLINIPSSRKLAGVVPVREFSEGRYVVLVTRKGTIKKTALSEFQNIRTNGINAINVDDGDELLDVVLTDGKKRIFIATHNGLAIRFNEEDVRPMGCATRGVRGIDLRKDDFVVSLCAVSPDDSERMLSVSECGFGKQTPISTYRLQSRGGKGVINMKTTEKTGRVVSVFPVDDDSEMMIITKQGKLIRIEAADIRKTGRGAQGEEEEVAVG